MAETTSSLRIGMWLQGHSNQILWFFSNVVFPNMLNFILRVKTGKVLEVTLWEQPCCSRLTVNWTVCSVIVSVHHQIPKKACEKRKDYTNISPSNQLSQNYIVQERPQSQAVFISLIIPLNFIFSFIKLSDCFVNWHVPLLDTRWMESLAVNLSTWVQLVEMFG